MGINADTSLLLLLLFLSQILLVLVTLFSANIFVHVDGEKKKRLKNFKPLFVDLLVGISYAFQLR